MKFNMTAFENLGKKKKFSLKKKGLIGTAVGLALVISAIVSGCALQKGDAKDAAQTTPPPSSSEPTVEVGTTDETPVEEDKFQLLADRLNISGLVINDRLTPRLEAEAQAALEALTPEGQETFKQSDVFIAPDGSAWISEEEYNKYNQPKEPTTEVGQGQYVDPDGNVWESEEAYLEYIKGQSAETGKSDVEGDYYIAEDGTVWTSKEEYEKYLASQNGQQETPVENGEVVEQGEGYKAPDGSYWSSEAEYLAYVEAQKQGTTTTPETPVEEEDKGQGTVEGNYYVAPDGSVWSSEAEYLAYIESQKESVATTTTTTTEETTFYEAPDGTWWESEADYLAFNASNSVGTGAVEDTTTTTVEVVTESEYTETEVVQTPDMSGYYQDPEGNWWASEADYLEYIASLEQTAGKTR